MHISNRKDSEGKWVKPHSVLFEVMAVDINNERAVLKSVGFSLLPLESLETGAVAGYYQLPIYKQQLSLDMFEFIKNLDPWGLVNGMNHKPNEFITMSATLLIRIQPDLFDGWLDNTKFNFELLNNMFMPHSIPLKRSFITQEFWEKKMKKTQKFKYDDKVEISYDVKFVELALESYQRDVFYNGISFFHLEEETQDTARDIEIDAEEEWKLDSPRNKNNQSSRRKRDNSMDEENEPMLDENKPQDDQNQPQDDEKGQMRLDDMSFDDLLNPALSK